MLKYLLISFLVLLYSTSIVCQRIDKLGADSIYPITIKGKVAESDYGEGLFGAVVYLSQKSNQYPKCSKLSVARFDGLYEFDINKGDLKDTIFDLIAKSSGFHNDEITGITLTELLCGNKIYNLYLKPKSIVVNGPIDNGPIKCFYIPYSDTLSHHTDSTHTNKKKAKKSSPPVPEWK